MSKIEPVLTVGEFVHLWDTHVGYPTKKLPLRPEEITAFAELILSKLSTKDVQGVEPVAADKVGGELLGYAHTEQLKDFSADPARHTLSLIVSREKYGFCQRPIYTRPALPAEPLSDFVRKLAKDYTDEARHFLDETYRFASQSPRGRDNINAAMQLLDDIDALLAPTSAHGIGKDQST